MHGSILCCGTFLFDVITTEVLKAVNSSIPTTTSPNMSLPDNSINLICKSGDDQQSASHSGLSSAVTAHFSSVSKGL